MTIATTQLRAYRRGEAFRRFRRAEAGLNRCVLVPTLWHSSLTRAVSKSMTRCGLSLLFAGACQVMHIGAKCDASTVLAHPLCSSPGRRGTSVRSLRFVQSDMIKVDEMEFSCLVASTFTNTGASVGSMVAGATAYLAKYPINVH